MAPEIYYSHTRREGGVKSYNGKKADIWACGVILFVMIGGFPPMQEAKDSDWWYKHLKARKFRMFLFIEQICFFECNRAT